MKFTAIITFESEARCTDEAEMELYDMFENNSTVEIIAEGDFSYFEKWFLATRIKGRKKEVKQ
jgi:hypothetical protein